MVTPLYSDAWDLVAAVLIFCIGGWLIQLGARALRINRKRALLLYCWHSLFCLLYADFILGIGGDAVDYYVQALHGQVEFSLGTDSISYITTLFASIMGLSFLGTSLVFNIAGAYGLIVFDAALQVATADRSRRVQRIALLIPFLPSLSFWSSAIGKDSLALMAVSFALWAALQLRQRFGLMAIAVIVMMVIRPHIAGLMVLALALAQLLHGKVSLTRRVLIGGTAIATAVFVVPYAMEYVGLGTQTDATALTRYIEYRQQQNLDGGSGIDISTMSFGMQLFTYLFRPLPYEAISVTMLAASIDNILLLMLFALGAFEILRRRKTGLPGNRPFLWFYALITWGILAITSANMGLAMRQKWMFLPILIFLFVSFMGPSRARHVLIHRSPE